MIVITSFYLGKQDYCRYLGRWNHFLQIPKALELGLALRSEKLKKLKLKNGLSAAVTLFCPFATTATTSVGGGNTGRSSRSEKLLAALCVFIRSMSLSKPHQASKLLSSLAELHHPTAFCSFLWMHMCQRNSCCALLLACHDRH